MMEESVYELVDFELVQGWKIKWNKITNVDPQRTKLEEEKWSGHLLYFFVQDMFWAHNGVKGIDVSWIQEGDPSGRFFVQVISKTGEEWDYFSPAKTLETRSLEELKTFIQNEMKPST